MTKNTMGTINLFVRQTLHELRMAFKSIRRSYYNTDSAPCVQNYKFVIPKKQALQDCMCCRTRVSQRLKRFCSFPCSFSRPEHSLHQ